MVRKVSLLGSEEVGTPSVVCCASREGSEHTVSTSWNIDYFYLNFGNRYRHASTALCPTGITLPRTGQHAAVLTSCAWNQLAPVLI